VFLSAMCERKEVVSVSQCQSILPDCVESICIAGTG
jgi:hypothetical protein